LAGGRGELGDFFGAADAVPFGTVDAVPFGTVDAVPFGTVDAVPFGMADAVASLGILSAFTVTFLPKAC
jgi:hypothetical protein